MSFNRLRYDKCAYELQMNRSTDPGTYRLFGSFAENCNQCLSYNGPVGAKSDVSIAKKGLDLSFADMADAESQLSWRNQILTECNDNKNPIGKVKVNHKPVCTNKLISEDTRFTYPLDDYRCLSLTSYQIQPYLPVNPQCNIQESTDRIGLNSRLASKDTYVMPEQISCDNGSAFPVEIRK